MWQLCINANTTQLNSKNVFALVNHRIIFKLTFYKYISRVYLFFFTYICWRAIGYSFINEKGYKRVIKC